MKPKKDKQDVVNTAGGLPVTPAAANSADIAEELRWLTLVLDTRFKLYFSQETLYNDITEIAPPVLGNSLYAQCLREHGFGFAERTALALSLAPHINPRLLDIFFTKNATFDRPFTEFGGYTHPRHQGFLPTGETLAFILAAADLPRRFSVMDLFAREHPFSRLHILELDHGAEAGPPLSGALKLAPDYLQRFTSGIAYRPDFGSSFPAQLLESRQEWSNLVLAPHTTERLNELLNWLQYGDVLLDDWGMRRSLRPGYRCLFYGPPGTGKSMTATLLGKITGRPVYRIDLSMVVSKYIGETEKNLSKVFDQAEHRNWILFFDEADALFGKRTEIRDAHDRYANQEVSYLLQRIETFDGLAILATNFRENLDHAFARRFESLIYFPLPKAEERLRIWQQAFPSRARLAPEMDLARIARQYELSGGGIMNVVRYASLRALANGGMVHAEDVAEGVRRELGKEGRSS